MLALIVVASVLGVVGVLRARTGAGRMRVVELGLIGAALIAIAFAMLREQDDQRVRTNVRSACERVSWRLESFLDLIRTRPSGDLATEEDPSYRGAMDVAGKMMRACVPDDTPCLSLVREARLGDAAALKALALAMRGERACQP